MLAFSIDYYEMIFRVTQSVELFCAYDIQEYSGDCASSSENNNGNRRIELDGMYHISTSKNKYYLNFYMVYKADDTPSDVGLSKIEIATEETVNRENFMWDTLENGIFIQRE